MPNSVRLASDTLVGREDELRVTLAALRDTPEGQPGVVTLSGPAGIGKSRFVEAVTTRLHDDGVRVMTGACLDLAVGGPPYSAFITAFATADPPAVDVLDALTGAADVRRSRLFELLRTTMAGLARRRPTVLVIEDLHWSDRITRDGLLYLVSTVREGRLALVVTFREDELAARPAVLELLDAVQRHSLVHVTLDALSPLEVAAQMAGITGLEPPPVRAAAVHSRTGGIPLLVEEVVAAEAAGTQGVPGHLRDLFLARVRRLGTPAADAVDVVAVVGDGCDERLAASALGHDLAAAAEALDRAVAGGVLVADRSRYRTRHELLREAVYGAIPPARRRRLHHRIAEFLAAAPRPDAAAVAYHWYQADEPTHAALANLDAAALADRVRAPGEVHTYLQRVLEHFDALPPDRAAAVGGRGAILARAAEAAYLAGEFRHAVALGEASLTDIDDPAEAAVRWERLARYCWVSRDGAGAQRAHERSVAVLPNGAPAPFRARVLSGYGWYLGMSASASTDFRAADARNHSDQALEAADESGDPLDRCRAMLAWGFARAGDDAGLAALWEARNLAVRCDAGDELGRAHAALDLALRRHGRTAEREQVLRDGLDHATAHGLVGTYAPTMKYLLAEMLLHVGRWDEAAETLDGIVAEGIGGVPAIFTHAYRAWLAATRGDSSAAAAHADQVASLSEDMPQQPAPRSIALCARAEACLWSGEPDEAMRHADQGGMITSDAMQAAEANALRARAAADLAARARRDGRPPTPPHDETHDDTLAAPAEPHPRLRAFAATARAEVVRRDGRRDPGPWRDAVAAWDGADDPYHAAYCRWRLAHALLATRAGRPEAARALDSAHRTAIRLRARPLRDAVEALAVTARIHLATGAGSAGPQSVPEQLGLTYREQEIVPHLVAGRTNAEIADTLVISPRTVGVHVSRILHKLGATRRTEAAELARRRGLVSDL